MSSGRSCISGVSWSHGSSCSVNAIPRRRRESRLPCVLQDCIHALTLVIIAIAEGKDGKVTDGKVMLLCGASMPSQFGQPLACRAIHSSCSFFRRLRITIDFKLARIEGRTTWIRRTVKTIYCMDPRVPRNQWNLFSTNSLSNGRPEISGLYLYTTFFCRSVSRGSGKAAWKGSRSARGDPLQCVYVQSQLCVP